MNIDGALDEVDRLIAAYRRTTYVIHGDAGGTAARHVIRLDRPQRRGGRNAAGAIALITAWNPQSRRSSMAYNIAAARRLQVLTRRRGLRSLPMSARPDDPRWPIEHGLAIIGIRLAEARRLAERFGQNALVYLARNRPPALVTTGQLPQK